MTPLDTSGALSELPEETQRLAIAASVIRQRLPEGWSMYVDRLHWIETHRDGCPWITFSPKADRWQYVACARLELGFEKTEGDGPTVEWAFDEAIAFIRSKENGC